MKLSRLILRLREQQREIDRLKKGQCIHYKWIHEAHHTDPVAGCPYKECHVPSS